MKKIVLILILLIVSMSSYAQVGGLDTLPESKRNEVLLKAFKEKLLKKSYMVEYYSVGDAPIIIDLGIWKDGDHLKLGVSNYKTLIGRRLYAVLYPSSEESLKYFPKIKNKIVVIFDAKSGESIYSLRGPSSSAIRDMKEHHHRKDSLNLLRLKYLEKEKRLKEIEDSISRDNGGRAI